MTLKVSRAFYKAVKALGRCRTGINNLQLQFVFVCVVRGAQFTHTYLPASSRDNEMESEKHKDMVSINCRILVINKVHLCIYMIKRRKNLSNALSSRIHERLHTLQPLAGLKDAMLMIFESFY